jgi:glutathione synthase/RimK-type ligase-like ATP-grasp enzyme
MKFGGAFLSSKQNYLKKIASEWTPKTLHVSDLEDFESIKNQLKAKNLNFPLIAKPDMGERGRNVEKMESPNEL